MLFRSNVVMLYSPNPEAQHGYVSAGRDAGYTVLHLESPLTSHLIQKLEMGSGEIKVQFRRVDADIIDRLIPKDDAPESALTEEQQTALKEEFEGFVPDKMIYKVAFAPMSPTAPPVTITQSEFMRRMKAATVERAIQVCICTQPGSAVQRRHSPLRPASYGRRSRLRSV